MKYLWILSLVLLSLPMVAQPAHSDDIKPRHEHEIRKFSPEQIASIKTKELTLLLDLSENQQNKVEALELKTALALKALHEQHENEKKGDDETRFKNKSEQLDHKIAYKNSLKSILTEAQFQKWESVQSERGKRAHRREQYRKNHGKHN